MNPIYKFLLSASDGSSQVGYPIWDEGLSFEYDKESNQEFFRTKLSGNLTFEAADYTYIVGKAFDTKFYITIQVSRDAGASWQNVWSGQFSKTDCSFDADAQTVVVNPEVRDKYADIIAGLDKEFNLIELAPQIEKVYADKRALIQVYVPGTTTMGCYLAGAWWEQECENVGEYEQIQVGEEEVRKLTAYLHFANVHRVCAMELTGNLPSGMPNVFTGEPFDLYSADPFSITYTNGGYTVTYSFTPEGQGTPDTAVWEVRNPSNVLLWRAVIQNPAYMKPATYTLQPISGQVSGQLYIYLHDICVYTRLVCNKDTVLNTTTLPLPENDITSNPQGYTRCLAYSLPQTIFYSTNMSSTPTPYGLYESGKYYDEPTGSGEFYPVSRSLWTAVSIWFNGASTYYDIIEQDARSQQVLRDAYPIASVLSVLLTKLGVGITHAGTTAYSQFLYGSNILGLTQKLYITPKSNMANLGYDEPAQKAPITLGKVLTMLRDCFRCYWFVDSSNRLRVEHIQYFRNGGSYSSSPEDGINLTEQTVSRNGKPWAFGLDKYKFEKPNMAARYQFGWMDDVTQFFEGYPIDVNAKFVEQGKIEDIKVVDFTTDIDYIMLNPQAVSKDGFVLLSAQLVSGKNVVMYYDYRVGGRHHYLQNGYLAFVYLQGYYAYDMPAYNCSINGVAMTVRGVKKLKVQEVVFPMVNEPDLVKLIRTNLGSGQIGKLSVNLSSRKATATLRYDSE